MPSTIGLYEQYALVPPLEFKSMMNRHWNEKLQMPSSPALRSLWEIMGKTFQRSITDTINERDVPWRVLQPPTGSGKTQGAIVYAAMQAKLNDKSEGKLKPVGLLIVTRLIVQADKLVSEINELAGGPVAIAHHSDNRAKEDDIHERCVLVITHQAYVSASEGVSEGRDASWDRLVTWRGGKRLLSIIDEALANVVDSNKVTVDSLSFVLGCVPLEVRKAYPDQIQTLETLHKLLLGYVAKDGCVDNAAKIVWQEGQRSSVVTDCTANMLPLRDAMRDVRYDRLIGEADDNRRTRIASRVNEVLEDVQAVMERWAYYARKGLEHSINSAKFVIPWGIPGPVVLDATASQNFLWELFEDTASIVPIPTGARSYGNVTLHVARASGVGKHQMRDKFAVRYPRLLEALESELGKERSVFMCVQKDNEHLVQSYPSHFANFGVGHWGAIDGRNDWRDFDTGVIFGLPYRDHLWSTSTFFALQGVQDDGWLKSPRWKQHHDVRSVMQERQLSVSIVQAINRICCRKVVNEYGESPPSDIYIVLPSGQTGDAILRNIAAEMPEINIAHWAFQMDGEKVRRPRSGTSHAALITFMRNRDPGSTSMSAIQRELGLKAKGLEKLKAVLRDASHATTQTLKTLGVEYSSCRGRGAKSFLVKHQAA
jgi:hypothetical protein